MAANRRVVVFLAFFAAACGMSGAGGQYINMFGFLVLRGREKTITVPLGRKKSDPHAISAFGENVFIGFSDGELLKIDGNSGKILWKKNLDIFADRPLSFDGENIYFVSLGNDFYVLDQNSGKIKFIYFNANVTTVTNSAPPVVLDNRVEATFNDGQVMTFSKNNWETLQ
ncbi:MAG: PQQ-like beta-propeller repeat protein [Rickettsiales bacterium]|jgi:outer membrane protein assembly factor BamB|nr:PQQ-like beta-propeller repeat protein [Rickettsiales bacterium]